MRAYTETVEVWRAPLVEGAYTTKRDWDSASLIWSGLGSVQPYRQYEARTPDRETAQERLEVYLPASASVVESWDRVRFRDLWYEIDGIPALWGHGPLGHVYLRIWRAVR